MQVGLSLHTEMFDAVLEHQPDIAWLEVVAENFFSAGGHHDKLLRLREDYDLSLHCLNMNIGGTDALDDMYLQNVAALCAKFQPTLLSGHISYETHAGECLHDLLPIPFNTESLRNSVARVGRIQETLQRRLLLENISYYTEYEESDIAEVEFNNALAKDSGAGLLLDLNNLWVNHVNLRYSVADYLAALHWDSVGEVHLAGGEEQDNLLIDTHGAAVPAQVLALLRTSQDKLPATAPIIYERDTNIPSLPDLLRFREQL
ncbi:MAG: DUF692 domain-containing protein [Pseudomonadota bacterium]|nr:DUF692 domain-containing protein [Pseudomonadota bacterium]